MAHQQLWSILIVCKYLAWEGWNDSSDKWGRTWLCLLHICNVSVTFYSIFNPRPLPAIIPLIFPLELAVAPPSFLPSPLFLSVYSIALPPSLFSTLSISIPLNLRPCPAAPHMFLTCLHSVCMFTCINMHTHAHAQALQVAQSAEPCCIEKKRREAAK